MSALVRTHGLSLKQLSEAVSLATAPSQASSTARKTGPDQSPDPPHRPPHQRARRLTPVREFLDTRMPELALHPPARSPSSRLPHRTPIHHARTQHPRKASLPHSNPNTQRSLRRTRTNSCRQSIFRSSNPIHPYERLIIGLAVLPGRSLYGGGLAFNFECGRAASFHESNRTGRGVLSDL